MSDSANTAILVNRYDEYGIPQSGNGGLFPVSTKPSPELYALASELFRDLWDARMKSSDSSRAHLIAEAARIDRQVATLVDRIVNADSPTLISAYEERLRALEIQKAVMRERVAECDRPLRDFDDVYRTAMDFLENRGKL